MAQAKRIELSQSWIVDGLAATSGDWNELASLYATTFQVEVTQPFMIICLREVPEKPWPLTIGGLPIFFTSDPVERPLKDGKAMLWRGKQLLSELNLREVANVSDTILRWAANAVLDSGCEVLDIFWWGGCWAITIPDGTPPEAIPGMIGRRPVFYDCESDRPEPIKPLQGVNYDGTCYDLTSNTGLRPKDVNLNDAVPTVQPDLKLFDTVFLADPLSGRREGVAIAVGLGVSHLDSERTFVKQWWHYFENSNPPMDGSRGAPILSEDGQITGFLRYEISEGVTIALAAAAIVLEEPGSRMC